MLANALFLDPNPRAMRGYAEQDFLRLTPDGSNVSAVVAGLCEKPASKDELLSFVRSLPEQDVVDVGAIGTPRGDVMLEVMESFGGGQQHREAALLSDGTLRVLAIGAALLSVGPGALVVFEVIDNGVHPSRAKLLLQRIHQVANERDLRVLLTTHNPRAPRRNAHRGHRRRGGVLSRPGNRVEASSNTSSDLGDYAGLVAQGPLGFLATSGRLEHALKARQGAEVRAESARVDQGDRLMICVVDTSVLCELLRVPGRMGASREVETHLESKVENRETLVLPLVVLFETGNHIGNVKDGTGRRSM